jgi:hypothetical protein
MTSEGALDVKLENIDPRDPQRGDPGIDSPELMLNKLRDL